MKALNNNQKANLKRYVLSCINPEYYGFEAKTNEEKVQFILDCFEKEFNYLNNKKRYPTLISRLGEWLQGLPGVFEVAFYNEDIINLGLKFGFLKSGKTKEQEYEFIDEWFNLCAASFFEVAKELEININYLK